MTMSALSIGYISETTHHPFHFPLSVFKKPENQAEYLKLEKTLEQLIDEVRDNE